LRRDDELRDEYNAVKRELCKKDCEQCYQYPEVKDGIIGRVLRKAGWTDEMVKEKQDLRIRRDRHACEYL
jgi:hypothetical protein